MACLFGWSNRQRHSAVLAQFRSVEIQAREISKTRRKDPNTDDNQGTGAGHRVKPRNMLLGAIGSRQSLPAMPKAAVSALHPKLQLVCRSGGGGQVLFRGSRAERSFASSLNRRTISVVLWMSASPKSAPIVEAISSNRALSSR